MQTEVIFRVVGEGGGYSLLRRRTPDYAWEFRVEGLDHSGAMLDEGENEPVVTKTGWVYSFAEAIALLDPRGWVMLHPKDVHPEFAERVLVEVTRRMMLLRDRHGQRADDAYQRWLALC